MSNLWLLESKSWPEDTRGEEARTAKFYLRPGTYTVGRQSKQCDIDIPEDKTISRLHAKITVPAEDWADSRILPHVTVQDTSRYGTLVTEANEMTPPGSVGNEAAARHRWLIRFGYQSPFRLHLLDWAAVLHPSCSLEIAVKADAVGFQRRTTFTESPVTTFLIVPGTEVPLDGTVLAVLLAGSPVVSAGYLEAWEARKVWKNEHPLPEEHAAAVRVGGTSLSQAEARGRMRQPGPDPVLMKGIKLLWHATGEGDVELENLREVTTKLAGGGAGEWPKTAAAAKKLGKGAVVVLNDADADVAARPFLAECRWATREDVVGAVVAGSTEGMIRLPQATQIEEEVVVLADEAGTPARRRKRGAEAAAEGTAHPATRHRGSQQAPAVDEDAETDDEEEPRRGKDISISVAATEPQGIADSGAPPSVTKPVASRRTRTATAVPSPSKIASGTTKESPSMAGKRRRSARGGAATLESGVVVGEVPSPPSVRPSPAKKSRAAGSPSSFVPETVIGSVSDGEAPSPASIKEPAAAVEAPRAAVAVAAPRPLPTPVGEGWHTVIRNKRLKRAPTPSEQPQRQETSEAATTVAEGATVTAVAPSAPQGEPEVDVKDEKVPKPAVDASAVVIDESLVVVAPATAGAAPGPRGFKAFRRKGDAVSGFAGNADTRPLIAFDPEPYREGGVNDDEYMRKEEERKEAARAADALFDANLKVKRDKKALDAGRTRLLALVPEGARRR